jgi:hypothetical protein
MQGYDIASWVFTEFMWHAPKLLDRHKCEYEMKTTEEQEIEACSLACSTLGVEGCVGALGWD